MVDEVLDRDGPTRSALFENADWRLLDDGIEHRGTGYFIEREALAMRRRDGLWEWPLQLAEKRWCTSRLFREAFLAALDAFGVARDAELSRSFAVGFGAQAGQGGPARAGFVALGELVGRKAPARKRSIPADVQARPRHRRSGGTAPRLQAGAEA